jgi:hypothetical protein
MGERDARAAWLAVGALAGSAILLIAWAAR